MSISERLAVVKTKLRIRLDNINTSLVAKGQTNATDLGEVSNKIESIQVSSDNSTSDATAYAEHILDGYTAYARGSKVAGNHTCATNTSHYQTQINTIDTIIGG